MSTAILQTACGCRRYVDIPDNASDWHAMLFSRPRFNFAMERENALADSVISKVARRFCWRGKTEIAKGIAGGVTHLRLFEEVDDAVGVVPPGAPVSLSVGEWADACARSSRFFGSKEWVEADQDFMRRHDGATLIQHKSGVLVGAFYIAPSWDNAESAVQVFSTLRRIMEDWP